MGFYSSLTAEKYDRQYSDRDLSRRMFPYFRPQLPKLIGVSLAVLVIAGAGALQPWIVSKSVDLMNSQPELWEIAAISGAVFLIGVTGWMANYVRRRLITRAIGNVLLTLARDAFSAAAGHDLSFYDKFSSGRIQSRITSDTREFGSLISIVTDVVSQIAETVILAVVLFRINAQLTLLLFAMMPVVFLLAIGYRSIARVVTRKGMQAMADVNASIKETISGIAIAKNFRQEAGIYSVFDKANVTSYKVNVRRGLVLSFLWPTLTTIGGVMSALLVYIGGMSVAQGLITAGAWYMFILSLDRFLFPAMSLSSFWTSIQSGLSAAERVFALIDAEPNVRQTASNRVDHLNGEVEFKDVRFQYNENELVLDDFNLSIAPGENIALVGHTGAGKSSIVKLIARFYEFQNGNISIDGKDIRTFDLQSFRKTLGIVSQSPFLFSGTVIENICYAMPTIERNAVEKIAMQIGEGEWVSTLPMGLDTQVGERGGMLSMGQRQLISLMRVLVQKPSIFILDEATASIDPFTEWQIQQALKMILSRSTSVLIAHRLSTVQSVDRIVVMQKGRIIEMGSHEQLLDSGGHYAELFNTYFRHQSLEYRPEGLDEFLESKSRIGM